MFSKLTKLAKKMDFKEHFIEIADKVYQELGPKSIIRYHYETAMGRQMRETGIMLSLIYSESRSEVLEYLSFDDSDKFYFQFTENNQWGKIFTSKASELWSIQPTRCRNIRDLYNLKEIAWKMVTDYLYVDIVAHRESKKQLPPTNRVVPFFKVPLPITIIREDFKTKYRSWNEIRGYVLWDDLSKIVDVREIVTPKFED